MVIKKEHQNLLKIINVEKWQYLQDSLATVTGMAIITVDYKGVPITRHSSRQMFCSLVREDPELTRHCQKCDSRGGLEATRLNKPYIYLCHYNILDAAIPILVNNNYLGAIMVGQVLPTTEEGAEELEAICIPSNRKKLERQTEQYDEYYDALPKMSLTRVKMVVEMLFHLCNYIVAEAVEKNLVFGVIASGKKKTAELMPGVSTYPLESLESVKLRIDNAITDAHIHQHSEMEPVSNNSILQSAFFYIRENKSERCTLKKMAELCHVSPSYFSRLFTREMGENFSVYLARTKINWATQLLETTDKTVSQIGSDVGFSDAGHFIKTFKKYEGITPYRYRQYMK